jgi:hypothetical protein
MAKYRKKALLVTAVKADIKQYITTLEGVTEAKVGDYIVTGVDNEQWALKPKWFNLAYTHIEGDTYQRKPSVLNATQIDESETVHTPNGEIKGDKGDYKVTGTKGEQWYVKPDIFDKTYEKVGKSMQYELQNSTHSLTEGCIGEPSGLQKAIYQIGKEAVMKSLGPGVALGYCDIHGHYAMPQHTMDTPDGKAPPIGCSICPPNPANGTSASDMELIIDLDPMKNLGTNPQQKITSYEQDVRGKTEVVHPTISPNGSSL